MKIEFMLREHGNHHMVGKPQNADCVPREGDYVALSDDDIYKVHSVHWYFFGKASVLVMLDP